MASSQSPSYFATIHGGNIPTAPGSASPSDPAAMTSLESAVPPLPLTNDPSHNDDDHADDDAPPDRNNHTHTATTTNTTTTSSPLANSTPHLQSRLSSLLSQSHALSAELTKKLATSRSGQSLLHIGPSLSTLPPDLALLSESLAPLLKEVEEYEKGNRDELERLVALGRRVQLGVVRGGVARECVEMYGDLVGAEEVLRRDVDWRIRRGKRGGDGGEEKRGDREGGGLWRSDSDSDSDMDGDMESDDELEESDAELHHVTSLERAAYTTLYLLQELQTSSAQVSALTAASDGNDADHSLPSLFGGPPADSNSASGLGGVVIEKSRFLMKLSPRIRRLESDTVKCLVGRLEELLVEMRSVMERRFHDHDDRAETEEEEDDGIGRRGVPPSKERERQATKRREENLLLMIGHCLRGLALLGKGADAESAFARVAIMPIIRSKLSMGKLDEGGSRGECAGLFFLLDDIANTVASMYGSILRVSEGMFAPADRDVHVQHDNADDKEHEHDNNCRTPMEVDLVTCGVWVPVATALMADPGIKMAIFSPGIANVLQANYSALDTFLSELASSLLKNVRPSDNDNKSSISSAIVADIGDFSHLYYQPKLSTQSIDNAQSRIYRHPTTVEFSKKWNLPIYYQLRFAEFCKRLDRALDGVRREGWEANVFTGEDRDAKAIQDQLGFELPIFLELYDTLLSMWKSNVFLRPLTHRFLRGAVQLVGRVLGFVKEGLDGNIEFGENNGNENEASSGTMVGLPPYFWHERVEDVAMVTWELTILDTCMTHDYLEVIADTVCPTDKESRQSTHNSFNELDEIRTLASDVLMESSHEISPVVSHSWNALIVDNLTSQCSVPLSAVKGVAATYRMTNRPPPTQASPFVATILRPLKDFDSSYSSRTPPQIGDDWKYQIIGTVSTKYSVAVEELIATVKRTEEALKSRKTRRMMAGGMSDGEKVKLQLYLDHREFRSQVEELGVDAESVEGLVKLGQLTQEAESLFLQSQNK